MTKTIFVIGSGGREHTIAWKLAQTPGARVFCVPGNPGTAEIGENIPIPVTDGPAILEAARLHHADLIVIGPEAPLAAGLADLLRADGFLVFGPSQAAAEIESSKAFSKAFMERHQIPAAASRTFDRLDKALAYLEQSARENPGLPVIKASGLAAGKGVYLPASLEEARSILKDLLVGGSLGAAGSQVLIEERLSGREVSVLAFTDGITVVPMPPAQDHKRLLDDDQGPNTGGMGAYAPSPACPPEVVDEAVRLVLQPAVDGLRQEGRPFVGVLYAGLMLTAQGLRTLEFNCRFGDPETQVILPLLQSDLLEIFLACAEGRLASAAPHIRWHRGGAACVVLAAPGYPERSGTGQPICGLDRLEEHSWAFHSGTSIRNGSLAATGGRVLGIAARGPDLRTALQIAYASVARVSFDGMHYRRDIGRDALQSQPQPASKSAYESAGVSIAAGAQAVAQMKAAVRSTFTPQVLSDIGSFGGLYHAGQIQAMKDPVLVASTDGVGTKVDLAAQAGRYEGLGHDIVNHCVNDILVQGAKPLFFLDYYATDRLDPDQAAALVQGISAACRAVGCALLGGETAEMPGVYAPNHFDVAGTIVGVVERDEILPRPTVQPGDLLIGLASSGPHTNGYSLIRKIFAGCSLDTVLPELGISLADALLAPHRAYLRLLEPLLQQKRVKALAHLTGGGFIDNIPRVLPPGCGVRVDPKAWPEPPLFGLIRRMGQVGAGQVLAMEMYQDFNMGIGMVALVAAEDAAQAQAAIPERTWIIGEVVAGEGVQIV